MPTLTPTAAADLFRAEPARLLDVGAGHAAYRCVGTGPDVLFVHGWPVSGATFRTLLPHLVDHVTCHVIDLPGAGSSRFDAGTELTVDQHIATVRRVIDLLGLDSIALVGHDSGGLIARHAVAGDPRVRAMGLIDTELPGAVGWRFRSLLMARHAPGFAAAFGWVLGHERVRRNPLVFGKAFDDPSLLQGEFDEFFLRPIHTSQDRRDAAVRVLDSFSMQHIHRLTEIHQRIDAPVQMVWGRHDAFFPVVGAQQAVPTFRDARLAVIDGAGLFSHEERPAEVARALLPTLTGAR